MNEQHLQALISALEHYFASADLDDEAENARSAAALLRHFGPAALSSAPMVIQDKIRGLVIHQTFLQLSSDADDRILDQQLRSFAWTLLAAYGHLIKAADSEDVLMLISTFPLMRKHGLEDGLALAALTLAFLWHYSPPWWLKTALNNASGQLSEEFRLVGNSSCKIALAYLLFLCEQRQPFQTYAVPRLAIPEQQSRLRAILSPQNRELLLWVANAIILDVASNGSATPPELNWERPNR